MRKKVFLTGTLVAIMLLLASTTAFAQGMSISNEEARSIKMEIKEGKPIKEVLEKHNITMGQVRSVLTKAGGFEHNGKKLTNTQIASIAERLGLDVENVQEEIESGKSLKEILDDNNITPEQVREAFIAEHPERERVREYRKQMIQERNETFQDRLTKWREDWKIQKFSWNKKHR